MINCYEDYDLETYMERTSPYPIYGAYRGQPDIDYSPLRHGDEEFAPDVYEAIGLSHPDALNQPIQAQELQYNSSQVAIHRVEGAYLNLERNLTNPGRFIAPQLLFNTEPREAFGRPEDVEDSAPDPSIQRSYGQWTAAPHDMIHTVPKQLLDYDYQALSQQDIADRARLSLRKALYGR